MLKASFTKQVFHFKVPSGTSRGVLTEKHAWFLSIWDGTSPDVVLVLVNVVSSLDYHLTLHHSKRMKKNSLTYVRIFIWILKNGHL